MRTIIVLLKPFIPILMLLLLGTAGTWRQKLSLTQGCSKGGILHPELVDKRSTLFPTAISLVCRCKSSIQQLRARLERFYMSMPAVSDVFTDKER